MPCAVCNSSVVVASCVKCGTESCGSHTIYCRDCRKAVCRKHVLTDTKGHRLCAECFEIRSRDQEDGVNRESEFSGTPENGGEAVESTSFTALMQEDEDEFKPKKAKKKKELDDDRPVLTGSGYQGPPKTAWVAAYLLFGASAILVAVRSPDIREIVWPFDIGGVKYNADVTAMIQDTNALRDTSNTTSLSMFAIVPLFVLGWSLFLAYLFGAFVIVKASLRSAARVVDRTRYQTNIKKF